MFVSESNKLYDLNIRENKKLFEHSDTETLAFKYLSDTK